MLHVKRSPAEKIFFAVLSVAVVLLFISPFYIAVTNSFKSQLETAENVLSLPSVLSFDNYKNAMSKISFTKSLLNTLIVTVSGVVLIVLCSALSGHAIARNIDKHPYFKILDRVFLSSIMIPFQVIMIPVYKIFKGMGLINNLLGMILMLTGMSVAYATFLYVGFIKSIPIELEEAARIDGCNQLQMFWIIVFPLLKPITATVAALHAMWLWNDFNVSLILLQKDNVRTLTIKQYYFFSQYASDYNMAFAAAIMGMIPVLIFFLLMQKHLVGGITAGAVKS
jgi:raffinose/stachyose/melibiose transport system permease protein